MSKQTGKAVENGFHLEVITPREMFFSGDVESVIVRTLDGEEGFMQHHTWCIVLLDEEGKLQIRLPGEETKRTARIKGGHIDVKEKIVIYTEEASWI